MQRLILWYYLGTPVFYAADRLFGLNVRVAFLDHWPAGRNAYYLLAFLLGLVAWRRPEWAGRLALTESGANVGLLIVSVVVWYLGVLDAAGSDFAMPQPVPAGSLVNFVLAAAVAGVSYTLLRLQVAR